MEVAEDIEYSGIRMQNWVLSNFGYQYILWPFRSLVAVPRLELKVCKSLFLNLCSLDLFLGAFGPPLR